MTETSLTKLSNNSFRVLCKEDGEPVKDFDVKLGYSYLISPLNGRKTNHTGRSCIVLSFIDDERACILLEGSNRKGKVNLYDLIPKESAQEKKEKLV